jgi:hypothetical protein
LNNLLKYNANTNVAIGGKRTMLIYMLGLEQFGQGVSENLLDLVLDGSRDRMEQMRACEMKLKQPQNGARLSPKPTPRSKRNNTREKHRRGGHLQR